MLSERDRQALQGEATEGDKVRRRNDWVSVGVMISMLSAALVGGVAYGEAIFRLQDMQTRMIDPAEFARLEERERILREELAEIKLILLDIHGRLPGAD